MLIIVPLFLSFRNHSIQCFIFHVILNQNCWCLHCTPALYNLKRKIITEFSLSFNLMITCNLDRLVFAFKQRSSDRSAAHRWNKNKKREKRNEKSHAENKMKWMSRVRLNDFLLITRKKKSFQCCPYDRHGTTKEMTMTMIIRWECVYLSLSISLANLFHDKWLFLIDLALCLIITRCCTIENFPLLLLLLHALFENFFLYALRY